MSAESPLPGNPSPGDLSPDDPVHRNEVVLAGRLATQPARRTLPTGDTLAEWRVVVRRPEGGASRCRVDALECVTFDPEVIATVAGWRSGDTVELHGALRRRFWKSPHGTISRYEIEVGKALHLRPAPPPRTPPRRGRPEDVPEDGPPASERPPTTERPPNAEPPPPPQPGAPTSEPVTTGVPGSIDPAG
ncbi:single-stranded DNA-binding protein [Bailinhaonella thermotolerans]|uniref:Single-stranded DNA-binding protein n=1 Tax=Bailinhaonella thermotolerans TaxID=1070861 RepID=A0A3A4A298_9ACTN|nr:single-stranded DNA-binding protein [Bailinhaonella thermotolerans]RJL20706.1 single-stranded DNA-binding protein [Bailinhaonella thermotolerans]